MSAAIIAVCSLSAIGVRRGAADGHAVERVVGI